MAGMTPEKNKVSAFPQVRKEEDMHELPSLSRLEFACMKALWLDKAVTVLDVQRCLKYFRPLAYTTVLTVLDRMAQKGAVTRTKKGRAFTYQPTFSFEESQARALKELIDCYFGGSSQKLAEHLDQTAVSDRATSVHAPETSESSDSSDISICLL
jgi:BlaI family transcriptional regulator, penicillinase repressor